MNRYTIISSFFFWILLFGINSFKKKNLNNFLEKNVLHEFLSLDDDLGSKLVEINVKINNMK